MRTNLTSLERLERQLQAITPDRAQGDAWEKALKGWINAGGRDRLELPLEALQGREIRSGFRCHTGILLHDVPVGWHEKSE